jgi:hypothetical protein
MRVDRPFFLSQAKENISSAKKVGGGSPVRKESEVQREPGSTVSQGISVSC